MVGTRSNSYGPEEDPAKCDMESIDEGEEEKEPEETPPAETPEPEAKPEPEPQPGVGLNVAHTHYMVTRIDWAQYLMAILVVYLVHAQNNIFLYLTQS